MVVVSLCRQLAVCAALLLYLVLLLRRLLRPRVEDYDTELLIGRLSHQVQDMEARLQVCAYEQAYVYVYLCLWVCSCRHRCGVGRLCVRVCVCVCVCEL